MKRCRDSRWIMGALAALATVGCGGRADDWDREFELGAQGAENGDEPQIQGLTGSLAFLDPNLNEVIMLTSPRPRQLAAQRLPVGRDVVKFEKSTDDSKLFVLSRGVVPRFEQSDEEPRLRVFDGGSRPRELEGYRLQDPYDQLEIDPEGDWLIVHGSEGLVTNPNELLLVELGKTAERPPSKTLDAYGGKPRKFRFTGELTAPGAEARRLLLVLREKDMAVIDLADLDAPEITVGMPESEEGGYVTPADIAYHPGIAGEVGPMIAVRLEDDPSVYVLTLQASTSSEHAFSLEANLVDVGGVPSTIDFVQTERGGGVRLAALVPSRSTAVLVDPTTSTTLEVALPRAFTQMQRITDDVVENSGQDVALLYGQTNTVAFWQLGATVGTPYRSIDAYDIGINVSQVSRIPGAEFSDRKVLSGTSAGSSRQFYVLDLTERKSFPLDALRDLTLNISPDGQRLWAYAPSSTGFAQLTFDTLQPTSLYTELPIFYVHDMETSDGNERSAVALHSLSGGRNRTLAATLFDGTTPNTAETKFVGSLELMGIQ